MTVKKRGRNYHYDFTLPGYPRMRGVIPEARTKWEAEQAEIKLKREVFENRYDLRQMGNDKLSAFIDDVFLPWSKLNKRTWREDIYISGTLKEYFRGKTLREITPMLIEKFKGDRLEGITRNKTQRCPAPANRALDL